MTDDTQEIRDLQQKLADAQQKQNEAEQAAIEAVKTLEDKYEFEKIVGLIPARQNLARIREKKRVFIFEAGLKHFNPSIMVVKEGLQDPENLLGLGREVYERCLVLGLDPLVEAFVADDYATRGLHTEIWISVKV